MKFNTICTLSDAIGKHCLLLDVDGNPLIVARALARNNDDETLQPVIVMDDLDNEHFTPAEKLFYGREHPVGMCWKSLEEYKAYLEHHPRGLLVFSDSQSSNQHLHAS